jgi:REP element-mobilizing transposase RayT
VSRKNFSGGERMARPIRVHVRGAAYHVLSRGNRGEHIFDSDKDKHLFIDIMGKGVERYRVDLHAYCVMNNHYHLLLSAPDDNMPDFMQYVGSGYGGYMQRRHDWIGHVFAGRYKSICVQKERYLATLSRYIHLNPVRAGKVRRPEEYPWSSYRCYVGMKKQPAWLNVEWTLRRYSVRRSEAEARYKAFVQQGIADPDDFPSDKVIGGALLGDRDFVADVVAATPDEQRHGKPSAKRYIKETPSLEELYREVCLFYGVERILPGSAKSSTRDDRAREMFIWISREKTTASSRDVARYTGISSGSAVPHQLRRTRAKLQKDPSLLEQWHKEISAIMSKISGERRGSGPDV